MDEALELSQYLPLSFKTPTESEYIDFLWEAFEANHTNNKYQFAFLAYHMLAMSFVYFNIWQIRSVRSRDFNHGIIGFSKDNEATMLSATSPFAFSKINESSVLRLLRLIECDNTKIGKYAKLVQVRNEAAHPNGNISFKDPYSLRQKITEVLQVVKEIQEHSSSLIAELYKKFLLESYDQDNREYLEAEDQIRESLIHATYMSQKDVNLCLEFNIGEFSQHPDYTHIAALHASLDHWAEH